MKWLVYRLTVDNTWRFTLQWHFVQFTIDWTFTIDWLTYSIHNTANHSFTNFDRSDTVCTTNNIAFAKDAIGLVMRRLPSPLPGTGAVAEYAELGNFGMRVLMSYQPDTLAQQFTVDVLYGCAVLRANHGVLVRS